MRTIIGTERQADGRFKFYVLRKDGSRNRSLRSWATRRAAITAGRRNYP